MLNYIFIVIINMRLTIFSLLLLLLFQSTSASTTTSPQKATSAPLPYGVSPLQPLSQTPSVSLPPDMYTPTSLSPPLPHTRAASNWTDQWAMHPSTTGHGTVPSTVFTSETVRACTASPCSTSVS